MIDLITPLVILAIVVLVLARKMSASIAILALLAGVKLSQLISGSIIASLPNISEDLQPFIVAIVSLLLTYGPLAIVLVMVKANKKMFVMSLLTSMLLGFMVVYFALPILEPLPILGVEIKKSGLFSFIRPYQTYIILAASMLALTEIIIDHRGTPHKAK